MNETLTTKQFIEKVARLASVWAIEHPSDKGYECGQQTCAEELDFLLRELKTSVDSD